MSSISADFAELRRRIKDGRELGYASFEPIYCLIFDPKDILSVKRQTPAWIANLKSDGWDVHCFSVLNEIATLLEKELLYRIWLDGDRRAPLQWSNTNKSIANFLAGPRGLQPRLETLLTSLEGKANTLVLVTDLEALHPYLRIGAIESGLYGKFHVPTVFFYPGERAGRTNLKFLGFYKEDGNYRSVHIGG